MGIKILKEAKEYSKIMENIKKEKLSSCMKHISNYLVSSAQKKINNGIDPENAPLTQAVKQGSKTLRDSGNLISSIAAHSGENWAAAGTNLKYAKINQQGGTISSKKSSGLWIPASANTRTLMRKYNAQKAGELISAMKADGYSIYRNKNICIAKSKRGKPFALFVIKESVEIPARPFLYIDESDAKYIQRQIRKMVKDSLKEGKQ